MVESAQDEHAQVQLRAMPVEAKERLRLMLDGYLRELSQYEGALKPGSDGRLEYPWFEDYWREPNRTAYEILFGETVAGFCLLRDTGTFWQIAEFYVLPEHRRSGIGTRAVDLIKEHCRGASGRGFIEAMVLTENAGSVAFWSQCGFELHWRLGGGERRVFLLDVPRPSP